MEIIFELLKITNLGAYHRMAMRSDVSKIDSEECTQPPRSPLQCVWLCSPDMCGVCVDHGDEEHTTFRWRAIQWSECADGFYGEVCEYIYN